MAGEITPMLASPFWSVVCVVAIRIRGAPVVVKFTVWLGKGLPLASVTITVSGSVGTFPKPEGINWPSPEMIVIWLLVLLPPLPPLLPPPVLLAGTVTVKVVDAPPTVRVTVQMPDAQAAPAVGTLTVVRTNPCALVVAVGVLITNPVELSVVKVALCPKTGSPWAVKTCAIRGKEVIPLAVIV